MLPLHEPLDPSSTEIRLLTLQPGEAAGPLCCELRKFSLKLRPQYDALSYTWDDTINKKVSIVNGRTVLVTTNLEAALRRLRY